MSKRKFSGSIAGKGYYIALILCAAAIGISGYLYYRNTNDKEPQLQDPNAFTDALNPDGGNDVPAVATDPQGDDQQVNSGTEGNGQAVLEKIKTTMPLAGETVADYAMNCLSYNQTTRDWRVHNGIDIAAEAGAEVCAAAAGTVYSVYTDETMGTTVVLQHTGGYVTKYASLGEEVAVAPGDTVAMGQVIGCAGNTALLENAIGDHLHFSVSCNGTSVDPMEFLKQE